MSTLQPISESKRTSRQELGVFFVLTFGLSSPWYFLIATGGGLALQGYVLALMWCPAVAAVGTQLFFHRTLRGLGWRWPSLRWVVLGYLVPLAYSLVAYGTVWLAGFGEVDLTRAPHGKVAFVVLGTLVSLADATGEEIGWRGFLVPALSRNLSFVRTAAVSGLVWGGWHLPLVLFSDYNAGTPAWYAVLCFVIGVVALSTILAWLRIRSLSFWPAAFLHASHNLYVQGFFDRITVDNGITRWLTGEFGAVFATTLLLTAGLFVLARRQLSPIQEGPPELQRSGF
jgi:membrane protease YdiL (CAAX protease family)